MRTWRARGVLVLSTLVICVLCLEIGLRIAGISYASFVTWDPRWGHGLRPSQRGWYDAEGVRVPIETNRAGCRDREREVPKPADTFRVALLGDSFAEAMTVPLEKTAWSLIEERPPCPESVASRVEVVNFGVAGYGTAQELLTLRHRVWPFDPDLVLLLVYITNDIRDNVRGLRGGNGPYFLVRGDSLVLDETFRLAPPPRGRFPRLAAVFDGVYGGSRTLQLAQRARLLARSRSGISRLRDSGDVFLEHGFRSEIFAPPRDSLWTAAWEVTERLVLQMQIETEARGIPFAMALASNSLQVLPSRERRRAIADSLGVPHLDYADQRLAELAHRHQIPVVNLTTSLRQEAEATGKVMHGSGEYSGRGHWNAHAHEVVAESLGKWLCSEWLLPRSEPSLGSRGDSRRARRESSTGPGLER